MAVQQLVTVRLDGHLFGIEVKHVQEVIRYQPMTAVPLSQPEITGLINLRGQIVTAMDLRRRLGLPDRPSDRYPMNVVIRTTDGSVSLLVDEIGDVVEVSDDVFERPPETLDGFARTLIPGAYKLDAELLLLLDTEKVVDLGQRGALDR